MARHITPPPSPNRMGSGYQARWSLHPYLDIQFLEYDVARRGTPSVRRLHASGSRYYEYVYVLLKPPSCCSRCLLSRPTCPNRPTLTMYVMANAASYLPETNSAWSGFKDIQISEEIETTCSSLGTGGQVMCPRFLALKTLANILQPFVDTRNASASVQRITSRLQRRAMDSCSLLHR